MTKRKTMVVLAAAALLLAGVAYAEDLTDAAVPNVSYQGADGVTLHGYLASPQGSGRHPAVLMIHEWWGLNRDIAHLADALAAQGFVVLAADGYRGGLAKDAAGATKLVTQTPAQQVAGDLDAALAYLKGLPSVDPARVASLGFCWGGTQSMYLGTRDPGVAAVVILYGPGPIQDASKLGRMKEAGPVLGIFGADDPNIPQAQVRGFEAALNAAGVPNTITVYPGVGHAFVKTATYQDGKAAEKAWRQVIDFLHARLG
jgi:carboxymethylenebutenolidase